MAQVSLQDMGFCYAGSDQPTLQGLNLEVADGEAHALLGASGAGKTTLLNLLSGLLAPTSGALCFNGQDVSQLTGYQRRVTQVFQFPVLYDSLSVAQNLAFPLRNQKIAKTRLQERMHYVAEELGIVAILPRSISALSLFEKQLVAVGKALMREDVSLVLLDEPLTAVEPKVKWRLRQALRKVQSDLGVTMIYVTHDQTEALTFADQVSILAYGEILQTGTPQQVYEAPTHEFVGHFVGSPGMNFLPASALSIEHEGSVGFRPEWCRLVNDGGVLRGQVLSVRVHGLQGGSTWGVVSVQTDHGLVQVRGPADVIVGQPCGVVLDRYLLYRDQQLVSAA